MIDKIDRLLRLRHFSNASQLIINRVFWRRRPVQIYSYHGIEFLVDHSAGDQDGTRSCLVPGLYEPYFQQLGPPRRIRIMDLGANGGGFVLALLAKGYGIESGVCIELNPKTWGRMVYNLTRNVPNALDRLALVHGAACGKTGSIEIFLGSGGVADTMAGYSSGERCLIRQYGFGELLNLLPLPGPVDLCKIDIEGAEFELFSQTEPALLKMCDAFLFETHPRKPDDNEGIFRVLLDAGFAQIDVNTPALENNVFLFKRSNGS